MPDRRAQSGDCADTTGFLLARAQINDARALEEICRRYHERLSRLANRYLKSCPFPVVDAEDAAQSALISFHTRFVDRQFPDLQDRDSLWNLLAVITRRKALQAVRREQQQKRGGGQVVALSQPSDGDNSASGGFEPVSREPDPQEVLLEAELLDRLFDRLDETNRQVTWLRLAGHTVAEIAEATGKKDGSVERRLSTIRKILRELDGED